jgi:hypothetical protein
LSCANRKPERWSPCPRIATCSLHARLEERSGGMLLVPSPTGRPCLRRNFSRKWTRRCVAWHCDEPAPYSAKAGRAAPPAARSLDTRSISASRSSTRICRAGLRWRSPQRPPGKPPRMHTGRHPPRAPAKRKGTDQYRAFDHRSPNTKSCYLRLNECFPTRRRFDSHVRFQDALVCMFAAFCGVRLIGLHRGGRGGARRRLIRL